VSVPAAHFDQMYAESADPWDLAGRWYDRRKYALTVASLPSPSYRRAFEPACSVGVLTELLAARCETLLATDLSQDAVAVTRRRLRAQPHVTVERQQIPGDWPPGTFDLIVLSEVGYYLAPAVFATVVDQAISSLDPDGVIVAAHWRHPIDGCPTDGDGVHDALRADPRLDVLARHEEADFLLEVLTLGPAMSIAAREGLVDGPRRDRSAS
jgi:SAM-dependent methyltransferase